ncbi:MAG TPA: fumarate reductase subunit FrdD [Thermoanaerobaculia bacterium]
MGRPTEPFFWTLFSAGGMLAALVLPAVCFVLWIAGPLGWLATPDRAGWLALLASPLARFTLLALVALALFHWAHRFRYTLYDGLQLHHLYGLIATVCYGGATAVTLVAAYLLLRLG